MPPIVDGVERTSHKAIQLLAGFLHGHSMNTATKARIEHLGQAGLKIDLGDLTVLVDPT